MGRVKKPQRKAASPGKPAKGTSTSPRKVERRGRQEVKAGRAAADRRQKTRAGKAPRRGAATRRPSQAERERPIMRVRELDPKAKIGPATGVQRLFRVDATSSGASETHLVFLDRHGLYCEHGRTCPAVAEVTKLDKSLKSTKQVG